MWLLWESIFRCRALDITSTVFIMDWNNFLANYVIKSTLNPHSLKNHINIVHNIVYEGRARITFVIFVTSMNYVDVFHVKKAVWNICDFNVISMWFMRQNIWHAKKYKRETFQGKPLLHELHLCLFSLTFTR